MEGYLEKLRKNSGAGEVSQLQTNTALSSPSSYMRLSSTPLSHSSRDDGWTRKWAVLDNAKLYYYDQSFPQYISIYRSSFAYEQYS